MNLSRQAPLQHPLAQQFASAVESLGAALAPASTRLYYGTARNFLTYLGADHPDIVSLNQLRRDPHILGWMAKLRSQVPPLAPVTYIIRLIFLRGILAELALSEHLPELAQLLRRQDVPRPPRRLPRALTSEQDQLLQQELLRRNDLAANVLLLLRHTGMRIGEAADLSFDCLHSSGTDQWAIQVPLGKLKTERMVPVDSFVCGLVHRLRFFRSFDPLPADGRLLARPSTREALIRQLRRYLHSVCAEAGIAKRIVPHQLRHTYASEMLRSGVEFLSVMKLLGHASPEMTMLYLDIALTDLQREFHLARSQPRHLAPQPKTQAASTRSGLEGIVDSLRTTQHVVEMYRRTLPGGAPRRCLDRLSNRLTKILTIVRQLATPE
ncbi:MAG TPA: site-specific integrase [Bryobacteraceae bacterium]|nr:site-specific integrase [Bryobacteraceae bacterium]